MQSCPFLLSHLLSSAKSVTSKSHFTFFSLPIKSFDSTGVHIDATVSKAFACHIINLRFLNPRFSGLWTPSVSQVFVVPIKTVNTSSPSPQSIIIFRLKSARYRPLAPAQATVSAKLQTGCPSPRTQLLLFSFAANFSVRSKFASCTVLYMPVVITSILPHCTALIMASIPIIAMIHWTVRDPLHPIGDTATTPPHISSSLVDPPFCQVSKPTHRSKFFLMAWSTLGSKSSKSSWWLRRLLIHCINTVSRLKRSQMLFNNALALFSAPKRPLNKVVHTSALTQGRKRTPKEPWLMLKAWNPTLHFLFPSLSTILVNIFRWSWHVIYLPSIK